MTTATTAPKVDWDYTQHASHYDKRADYSPEAIAALLQATACAPSKPVAEVGAGTGKLTKELLRHGLTVSAVEPNEAMRTIGIHNTRGKAVTWSVGTGEATGLPDGRSHAVFFGSSFNVVGQSQALREVARILDPDAKIRPASSRPAAVSARCRSSRADSCGPCRVRTLSWPGSRMPP
jgi:ubiquinone/menaquinone biosynthesis C-methylase UbiE